jgi:hypothetical protein
MLQHSKKGDGNKEGAFFFLLCCSVAKKAPSSFCGIAVQRRKHLLFVLLQHNKKRAFFFLCCCSAAKKARSFFCMLLV